MKHYIMLTAVSCALAQPTLLRAENDNNDSSFLSDNTRLSLILDATYVDRSNTEEKEMPGFPTGGHSHGLEDGFSPGHSELALTHEFSDKLTLQTSTALLEEDEKFKAEVEELYLESVGIANGINIKAGRFLSDIGYLSSKHTHEWDFTHNPLMYSSFFGGHANDDGLQVSYLAPTDNYLEFGAELLKGAKFPSGETGGEIGAVALFAKTGGDIGTNHSWLAGIGRWQANDIEARESAAHDHEEEHDEAEEEGEEHAETPTFRGDSAINAVNFVYKWSPNGNWKQKNFKFSAEYFKRDEDGNIDMVEEDGAVAETSTYKGKQTAWYASGVYQFQPRWRVGMRYEQMDSDNNGSDTEVLQEAELIGTSHKPERSSIMVDFSQSHYSRLRLQYTRDDSGLERDNQVILQYTHSFGSHGAHRF